ncbi:MAG: hypothetical protein J07HR59_00274 [Halorubrum sp. J07HR59]|nr:MAG: hypothetical protein J07HR59_00274 [Halorubrum sp. J07HR59]
MSDRVHVRWWLSAGTECLRNRFEPSDERCEWADDESPFRAGSAPAMKIPVSSEAGCYTPFKSVSAHLISQFVRDRSKEDPLVGESDPL